MDMAVLTEIFANFHFVRYWWLLAALPLAGLWWLLRRPGNVDSPWRWICDERLLSQLMVFSERQRRSFWWLLGLGWIVTVVALAGPTWQQRSLPVFQKLDARIIVLDLSRSMNATDLKPSRISRARFKVADILESVDEGQVGLVVYAGDAFVVSPLTQDTNTVQAMVPVLDPEIMPSQGSRLDLGLRQAQELFAQASQEQGEILVIADSVDQRSLDTAAQLANQNLRISVLGVGTPGGAPVPVGDGFLRDGVGNMVVPTLNPDNLRRLADVGGGQFTQMTPDSQDVVQLLTRAPLDDPETQQVDRETDTWREEGPWLVLALLPMAALAFRRGWLLMVLVLVATPDAQALEWADLWERPEQQADRLLREEQPMAAAEATDDPLWRGTALYRAGEFEASLMNFAQVPGSEGHYNQGNALAQLGRIEEAIAAYDAALSLNPDMEDAQFNRDLLERLLRQQQAQSGQNQEQGDNQGDQNQQGSPQPGGEPGNPQDDASIGQTGDQTTDEGEQLESEPQLEDGEQDGQPEGRTLSAEETLSQEEQQALEQWLRRIPDDPGGLLRRKFRHLCNERGNCRDAVEGAW